MDKKGLSDPFTISLAAQRGFHHNLLFALIEAGALTQSQAGAVAGKTADFIRELKYEKAAEAFGEHMAIAYEQMAAHLLGLPRSEGPNG